MKRSAAPSHVEVVTELLLLALVPAVAGWAWSVVMPAMCARLMEGLLAGGGALCFSAMWTARVLRTPKGEEK